MMALVNGRSPRRGRSRGGGLAAIGVLLGLLAARWWGVRHLRAWLEGWAGELVGLQLRAREARVHLLPPELILEDVGVGPPGKEIALARRAVARLDLLESWRRGRPSLERLELVRPVVNLRRGTARGKFTLPPLGALLVQGGTVLLAPGLSLRNLDLELRGLRGPPPWPLRLRGCLRVGGNPIPLRCQGVVLGAEGKPTLDVEVEGGPLRVERLWPAGPLRGTVRRMRVSWYGSPREGRGFAEMEAPDLRLWLPSVYGTGAGFLGHGFLCECYQYMLIPDFVKLYVLVNFSSFVQINLVLYFLQVIAMISSCNS